MSDIVSDNVGPSETGAWLTLEDAARFLRVTVRTVDRRSLPKRHLPGQPVEVWVAGASSDDVSDLSTTHVGRDDHADERAIALSERVSDVVGRQMAPLLAELAASRQRIEDLARENGRLTAELEALRASHSPVAPNLTAETTDPTLGPPHALIRSLPPCRPRRMTRRGGSAGY